VSSPREPRFVLVPICFASKAWPRSGLAGPRSASIAGFGKLESASVHGRSFIHITTTKKRSSWSRQAGIRVCFGFAFGIWNWYCFGGSGASLIWALHGKRKAAWQFFILAYLGSYAARRWLIKRQFHTLHLQIRWCCSELCQPRKGDNKVARSKRNFWSTCKWGSKTRAPKQGVLRWRMGVPSQYMLYSYIYA